MRYITAFSIITLLATSAWAQKIVVQSGPYKMLYEDELSDTRAKLVTDEVASFFKDQGIEVIKDGTCDSKACLETARTKHDADEALYISTEQTDARYLFEIVWAKSEGAVVETTGAFSSAMEKLNEALKPRLSRLTATAPETEKEKSDEKEKVAPVRPVRKSEPAQAPPSPVPTERRKIVRKSVIATLVPTAVAGAVAIGFDIAVNERYEKMKKNEKSMGYWRATRELQITEYTLLTVTAVGALVSVAVPVVIYYKMKNRRLKSNVSLSPCLTKESVMMVVNRSF